MCPHVIQRAAHSMCVGGDAPYEFVWTSGGQGAQKRGPRVVVKLRSCFIHMRALPAFGERPTGGARSAREAAGVEKGLLLRCRDAPQYRVTMGKAAEATNDVGMVLGICHEFVVAVSARQVQASGLIGQ